MASITMEPAEHLKAMTVALKNSDFRDKLTAAIQYAAMFVSAGEPGNAKKVQASVAAARKVFRVMRPLEAISPVLLDPHLNPKKPVAIEILNKLKGLLMAIYFGADHVVWASQAGIYTNKERIDKAQKLSLWGWALGSVCTVASETYEVTVLGKVQRRKDENDAEWHARRLKAQDDINKRMTVLTHAVIQAVLAAGLLQLRPMKPRTIGLVGIAASVMNCFMLYPALPPARASSKPGKVAEVQAAAQQSKMELKKA